MGSGAVAVCSRCFIVLLNIAMLFAGLVLIALTLWVRLDERFEYEIRRDLGTFSDSTPALYELKQQIRTAITVCFWVLIGFGAAGVIISIIGATSGCCGLRCSTCFYLLLLLALTLLEIAVGIFILVQRQKIRETVQSYVFAAYQARTLDYDSLRMRYDCCGVDGTADSACSFNQPTCTVAVWDRLDFTLMITGIILVVIVVLQLLTLLFGICSLAATRRRANA